MNDDLPVELARLVRETIRRTRLWSAEREDVARELGAHFSDGLAAGRSAGRLAVEFGDPARAARLITRARRRMRPLAWRLGVQLARAGAAAAALALAIYAVSAVRLYSAAPAVSHRVEVDERPAPDPLRHDRTASVSGGALAPDFSVVWPRAAEAARARSESVRGELAEAQQAAASGDGASAVASLRSAREALAELDESTTLPGRLAALEARTDLSDALAWIVDQGESGLAPRERDAARLIALDVLADAGDAREPLRSSLVQLLDRIYAPDGRLSGQGLRLLQAMMGKTDPGPLALALEPAYFAFPADRDEVQREANRLLELVGNDRLAEQVEKLRSSPMGSLRYVPLALVMPTVAATLDRWHAAQARLASTLSRSAPPVAPQ